MYHRFLSDVQSSPIIAAVNDQEKLEPAIHSPCEIIFLLYGSIFNLKEIVDRCREQDKCILIHIDLMEGLSKDAVALKYLHYNIKPDGIITTKSNLIKIAKDMGMFSIQRLFILDSLSLDSGIKSIHATRPDAIEILPGIMPKIIQTIHHETRIPVVAGGLIGDKEDVVNVLKAGAVGVSTSKREVWYM
ncbi:MAG: glycerol-3-phosphate responsive antiterminator [Clostridia bacterium]